jgi:hypothetical protein
VQGEIQGRYREKYGGYIKGNTGEMGVGDTEVIGKNTGEIRGGGGAEDTQERCSVLFL